jgi:phosphoribosyl-AMP cyclohydrolase
MEIVLIENIKFDAIGLVPAIVQDAKTNEVLMMAWMNAESLHLTIESGDIGPPCRGRVSYWRVDVFLSSHEVGATPRGLPSVL